MQQTQPVIVAKTMALLAERKIIEFSFVKKFTFAFCVTQRLHK